MKLEERHVSWSDLIKGSLPVEVLIGVIVMTLLLSTLEKNVLFLRHCSSATCLLLVVFHRGEPAAPTMTMSF